MAPVLIANLLAVAFVYSFVSWLVEEILAKVGRSVAERAR
jgi:hypothetical protein